MDTAFRLMNHVSAEPFCPFRIKMAGGVSFEIRRPEMVQVGRTRAVVSTWMSDSNDAVEARDQEIPIDLIESIEPLAPATGLQCDVAHGQPASVFVVQHLHILEHEEEDVKMIGVYASRGDAEDAVNRLVQMPGFNDFPEIVDECSRSGFFIEEYRIGEDHWREGFVTEFF
jgi:hypothetical protein